MTARIEAAQPQHQISAQQRERLLFVRELNFIQAVAEAAGVIYSGVLAGCCSSRTVRVARVRELILAHQLTDRRVATNRPETFAQRFEQLYRERLVSHPNPPQLTPGESR